MLGGPVPEQAATTDWLAIVTAVAVALGTVFAGAAVVIQGRSTRRQLGIQNMWRLIDRWDSLGSQRVETANHLLAHWEDRGELPDSVDEVLGTFELLGYLVIRSETLGLEDAWINFSGPAIQWWHVCRPGIERLQEDDHTVYEDYASLAERLMAMEADRRGLSREALVPSEEDLKIFLRGAAEGEGRT